MTNKEKYGNEIIELTVNGGVFGLKMESLQFAKKLNVKSAIFMNQIRAKVVRIISANGLIRGMLSRLLIGIRLQSIHRFWSEILNFLRGAKNILQNMKMKRFIHGITEKRHGAHTTVK